MYITTPIYYVNDKPHIGHAYTNLLSDFFARFYRLCKEPVVLLTGTDEHGQKIEKSAKNLGISPTTLVDRVSKNFFDLAKALHLSNDDFIRTTEARHHKAVCHLFETIQKNGWIYKGSYSGWYASQDEAFYKQEDLIEGKAPTGAHVEWVCEESYFFKLSAFQEKLLDFYKNHPDFVMPHGRYNEVIRFVEGGLDDLSISRTGVKWGIPVPGDPDHVIYVWMDALCNYLSAIGYPNHLNNDLWEQSLHILGKDIIRFHAVYWPAFLMAADLPPPSQLAVHGWWTNEKQKISKSLGNVIDPIQLINDYSCDALRYFLLKNGAFSGDTDFSISLFEERYNSDLVNRFGNLVQRVLVFLVKNLDGIVPLAYDKTMQHAWEDLKIYAKNFQINCYVDRVFLLIDEANRYMEDNAPWAIKKLGDKKQLDTVMGNLCEMIKCICFYLSPVIPEGIHKCLSFFGIEGCNTTLLHRSLEGIIVKDVHALYPRLQKEPA